MPLFDSLSKILYLVGKIEDAIAIEMIVVNATIVFSNMLLGIMKEKKASSLARVFYIRKMLLLFGM